MRVMRLAENRIPMSRFNTNPKQKRGTGWVSSLASRFLVAGLAGLRMLRHVPFRYLLLAGVACFCAATQQARSADFPDAEARTSGPPQRNVVLVTFDDLRQDTPGFNGGPAKTPQMDRLAANSTNFRNAMTTVGLWLAIAGDALYRPIWTSDGTR